MNSSYLYRSVGRVFGNGPGDWGSIPGKIISKTQRRIHDTSLLYSQHSKITYQVLSGEIQ